MHEQLSSDNRAVIYFLTLLLILKASASSQGSDEPMRAHSLVRAFVASIHTVW